MPLYLNPAAGLTANRIPYALGNGRLGDSARLSFSAANCVVLNQAQIWKRSVEFWDSSYALGMDSSDLVLTAGVAASPSTGISFKISSGGVSDGMAGTLLARIAGSGAMILGRFSDAGNGRIQVDSHSAFTGGLAFGTDATGAETIWRHAAGVLRTGASLRVPLLVDSLGFKLVGLQRPYDWKLPTGARSRATFDPASVTLSGLAERVAALIYDLHRDGAYTATGQGHGLLLDANY